MICYPKIQENNITIFEKNEKIFVKSRYLPYRDILLNDTSLIILNECIKSKNSKEIQQTIMQHFSNCNEEIVENDINRILKTFSSLGMIEWTNNYNPFAEVIGKYENYEIKMCDVSDAKRIFDQLDVNISNIVNTNYLTSENIDNLIYALMIEKFLLFEVYDDEKLLFKLCLEKQLYNSLFSIFVISWDSSLDTIKINQMINVISKYIRKKLSLEVQEIGLFIKCVEDIDSSYLKEFGFVDKGIQVNEIYSKNVHFLLKKVKL